MSDFTNRDGYKVEVSLIEKVDLYDNGGCAISRAEPGWGTFGLSETELAGFIPKVDDVVIVYTKGFSEVRGVVIDGRVLRYKTPEQSAIEFKAQQDRRRLEKLERYITYGDELKERVKALHPILQARMARFAAKDGVEFWIDSAGYEMACLEGTQALLNKVESLDLTGDDAVQWVNDWWDINSDKHDPPYDYKKQMEIVPDFGDGHSGNTAGAAKAMAIMILEGNGDKL